MRHTPASRNVESAAATDGVGVGVGVGVVGGAPDGEGDGEPDGVGSGAWQVNFALPSAVSWHMLSGG